jgi:hypothetical protein
MTEDIKSPFGSDFGKPRPYAFDTIGFSESETRAIENAQLDAAASSQVPRAVYAGVPLSQAVRDGAVKEENGVYRFGNCKVSAKGSPIVAFDDRGGDFIMTKATGQRLMVENSQIDDATIFFDADITIKNSQLCGKTEIKSHVIDDEFYQYNQVAVIEDSYVLDSKINASTVKNSRVIDSNMRGGSHVEKATLVNSGIDQSKIEDAMVEKCGMINSDVIRVGQVKETAMFVSTLKDVLSVDKSQLDFSNIVNSGRLEHVDAYDVSVEDMTESNVQLRSDDANNLVVTELKADSEIVDKLADLSNKSKEDDVTIDESQFDMAPQKGLQQ